MRALNIALFTVILGTVGCDSCNDDPVFCPGCSGDTDTDTDADTDTDTDADSDTDTDTDTPVSECDGFDDPGDICSYDSDEGEIIAFLTDQSGDDNRDQEFYAVVVNTAESGSLGFRLQYEQDESEATEDSGAPAGPSPSARRQPAQPEVHPFRRRLREWKAQRKASGYQAPPPPPPSELEVGVTNDSFFVRNDLTGGSTYAATTATLAALGDTVAIWVDDGVAIDWDYDCDGKIDEYEDEVGEAYGFDNCDLETMAAIVDKNIMVNLEDMLGEFSDVNGDDRVTVLITPYLNYLPTQATDPDDQSLVIESYCDPEVDLEEWNEDNNPGSNYQEIIYVFAPDPIGRYNINAVTGVEAYTNMSLATQIAHQTTQLILHNQKVLLGGGDGEASWLTRGLGAVAADICGFGAVFYDDAWEYLDSPHLHALTEVEDDSVLSLASRGAQYLFVRWLVDVYGTEILGEIAGTTSTGQDAVAEAVAALGGDSDIDILALQWHVAMLASEIKTDDGSSLLSPDEWPQYAPATTIAAPTEPPDTATVGTFYGANGYQTGLNIRGTNRYMTGGTTKEPEEDTSNRVVLGNSDHSTYVQGYDFYGHLSGGFTGSVVRLPEPPFAATSLQFTHGGSDEDVAMAVIRWNDASFDDVARDAFYSSSDTDTITLASLPEDGTPIYGVGRIGDVWPITTFSVDGTSSSQTFYDSDRWLLDLSDRAAGSSVHVHIWLDRQYENDNGDIAPYDPWFAVVPQAWVPTPTYEETNRASCVHADGVDFEYPISLLDYLFYQLVIPDEAIDVSNTLVCTEDMIPDTGSSSTVDCFDACGVAAEETTSCANDWDGDDVLDEAEPQPGNFYEQVMVQMCDIDRALVEDGAFNQDWFDQDSIDEDDAYSYDQQNNTGGASDSSGEEAWLDITLEGGESYVIVVSGGSDQGVYEFAVQEVFN